jgi:ADP-ribosyl-[dinitrogen reductase] hydrolase
MLAEALLSGGSLDLEDLAGRFLQWANESGRGMGNLTRRVLQQLSRGVAATEAAKQVWEMDGRRSAGNGSVMRCSPVALRWRRRPQLLVQETLRSARVTHYDPRCQWSAVAVNVALAHSLEERPIELPALAAALDKAGAPDSVGDAVRFAAGHSLDELVLDDPRAMGYTLKAMQAGLWVSTQEDGFEEALIGVVSAGGDTDTNGAVAGAMLGGVFGDAGIPARWLQCVPDRGRLEDLAGQLLAACDASG